MRGVANVVLAAVVAIGTVPSVALEGSGSGSRGEVAGVFAAARPSLVAISVADIDVAVGWYSENMGFRETKRMDLPNHSLRIAFLELNGFRLELVEFKDSVPFASLRSKFPNVDDRAKVQGLAKLAFAVENIERVAAWLKARDAEFVRNVTQDKDTGEKWFIVEDPDGNWLQFFGLQK